MSKKIINKITKTDIIIIIVSLLMMVVVLNLPFKAKAFGDDLFHKEAKNFALYIKGDINFDAVTITRAPAPVLCYSLVYVFVPSEASDITYWSYAVVFMSLILIISMMLIFRIGSAFFSKEVGLLSIVIFFIFPIHFYYSLGIGAEVFSFFSITIALYGWSKIFIKNNDKKGWLFFIIGICFLILNRPNALLILPMSLVIVLYAYFKNKEFYNKFGLKIISSVFIIGLLSFSVLKISKSLTNSKSEKKQEELFYYVAHQGRFQFREEPLDLRYWESDVRSDSRDYQNWLKSDGELDIQMMKYSKTYNEVYKNFLINDFFEHPFLFIRQFFVKCFYGHIYIINSIKPADFKLLFFNGKKGYTIFILLVNSINILIVLGFFIFLFTEKNLIRYWLFWSIILALIIFHGMTYMEPRYLFPSRVALYLMSSAGLCRIKFIKKFINKLSIKLI